ncbi:MAG: hypothetical protein JWM71_350 [Solirubrobacteraceae bacterium]|nr:hypothetical protein [Solirubrobacteraceae bacterium]
MKSRLCLLLALTAVPLAGCGSSGSSGSSSPGADPAKLAPAAAPIYLEAVVRPDGSLGDGAKAALGKLLHTSDPGAKITALLDKAAAKDDVTWEELKPWLGQRLGIFLTSVGAGSGGQSGAQGALIADTTDTGKAQATLDKIGQKSAARDSDQLAKQTYKGVTLQVDAKGDQASGIVGDYAVVGSVAGVHQVVDVAKGGRPLTDVADYTAARAAVKADDGLAMAYAVPSELLGALSKLAGSSVGSSLSQPQTLAVLRGVLSRAGRSAAFSLHADGSAVRVDTADIGAPANASGTAAADALAALPSDAWLGLGFGDLGGTISRTLAQFGQLASLSNTSVDIPALLARFKASTGIDIQKDFLSWMGDGAIYARGTGLADIGGALTIKSTNPAKSHKAVLIIARGLQKAGLQVQSANVQGYDSAIEVRSPRLPVSVFVAAGGNHFSVGINPQALTDLLHPSSTLGSSATYANARKALGGDLKPVFVLDTPSIVGLLEGFGLSNQPSFAKAKPILDVLGPISVGTAHDGNVARAAFALALR